MVIRPLNEATLAHHAERLSVPTYDRSALVPGVVHVSVGSFHRAHQAVYFDELARRGAGDGWGLVGVGLRRREMKEALDAQDGLYTVVTRGPRGDSARVIGAIVRYLFAPEEAAAVVAVLADERTRLVTLTVTPAGYDLDSDEAGASAPELIVEALARRRRAGLAPFTVLSCDNMPANGEIARQAVVATAARRDESLARWIADHVAFPSSMVDRITPGTTLADQARVARQFGVNDRWPVITEPFSEWIVEDEFSHGRPPLDEVGVRFVSDVRPYAVAKTRLLNGSHSALGYLGSLAGHTRLDATMRDPVFAAYVKRLMDDEVAPQLPRTDVDHAAYGAKLRARFANPAIADRLSRLCRNGSAKVPRHLLASIEDARADGSPHPLLTVAVAGWCRYLRGLDESGRELRLEDPAAPRLRALARAGGGDPRPLLGDEAIFGSLGRSETFVDAVHRDLAAMTAGGVRAVVAERTAGETHAAAA